MGYTLFGMAGVFLVSPLFGALSVLLIVLVGRRLFGSVAGGAAAFLLLVNLAQCWSARTSGSEVMFQTAFLAAVLFWALYSSTGKRPYAIFAGLGFRALMLIRVDSLLVLTGVLAFFLYLYATRGVHRKDLFFILPLVAVTGLGLGDSLLLIPALHFTAVSDYTVGNTGSGGTHRGGGCGWVGRYHPLFGCGCFH